jgi:2'-5' RNA ligase
LGDPIRTFIAIAIPNHIRERIGEFQNRLRKEEAMIKWVRPESIHITLKFLGDVAEERIDDIAQAAREVVSGREPFEVGVGSVGTFPNDRRPRVLWIGVQHGSELVADIARRVDRALTPLGFKRDKRLYSAHLTIGRVRSPQRIKSTINTMQSIGFTGSSFKVETVDVMKSQLLPTGAVYTKLREIKLKG